jgi:micrococcal nuclease
LTLLARSLFIVAMASSLWACETGGRCGPSSGVVARVLDGDTVELESGEKIRYLMVDTPEYSGTQECYGVEARQFNIDLVEGQKVELRYDSECTDRYDRLLAYVYVDGREINSLLVERGFACTLYIPPNGSDRKDEFEGLESQAKQAGRGLWGVCETNPC